MIELQKLVEYFDEAEDASYEGRKLGERCRDYYDGEQLTAEQKSTLRKRNQPEVVFNLVQPKVDFLLGQERETRTDPKAFPRTPDHDEAADAATDAIRYVCDNNNFEVIASEVFENIIIEGTGGCAVEAKVVNGRVEVALSTLRWDRLFIDPHSYKRDASDAMYIGYISWKDMDAVIDRWPSAKEALTNEMALHRSMGDTFDDKPERWYSSTRNRVMCVDICFKYKGVWHNAIYAKGAWLEKPAPSAYVDSDGTPQCKFIITSAKVDRDGNRYGYVKQSLDPQTEVNSRRSKALHLLNVRQTFGRAGAIHDLDAWKKEGNKPDGHQEIPPGTTWGKDVGFIENKGLVGPQFEMYMEAKQSMDMSSAKAALQSGINKGVSGRAIRSLLQGVMMENVPLFDVLSQWKKMVYRAVWDRIKQFWREERWIRVTDDDDNLQWVGLNTPMTLGEQLVRQQTGLGLRDVRRQFGPQLMQLYMEQPMMQQVAIENAVAEIDVDIIIEEVPDVTNLQSEQFELLVQMYQANPEGIRWEDVIEMSTLRNKKRILGKETTPEQQAQMQAQQQKQDALLGIEVADKQASTAVKQATAMEKQSKAQQTQIETIILANNPDPQPQTVI